MKKIHVITAIITGFIFLCSSCKEYIVKPVDPLTVLPPATQTGARTFGCLVNGNAFVPKNRSIFQGPQLLFDFLRIGNGYYILTIGGGNPGKNGSDPIQVVMRADSMKVSEGQTVPLTTYNTPGMAFGEVMTMSNSYYTNLSTTGQLHITRMDTIKQIVSGTFYFTAANKAGDTIKVTAGRFDMTY